MRTASSTVGFPGSNKPCSCFNALLLSLKSSQFFYFFLTRGPIFSFHTEPCKLCSRSWSEQILSLQLPTKSQMLDKSTPGGLGPSVLSWHPGVLPQATLSSSTEDKSSLPCQQAASGTFCAEQHPFLLAHACTHKLNKYNGNDMCKPRYRLAVASPKMDNQRSVL